MLRTGARGNELRLSLHCMPNCTRVIVPPMAGLDGVGGWRELYLAFTPIDDETNRWFITNLVGVTGAAKDSYLEKRAQYYAKRADAGPAEELAREVMDGRVRFQEIDHPDRVRVQDIAVQAGQGPIADRSNERLGRSDLAIIVAQDFGARIARNGRRPAAEGMDTRPGRHHANVGVLAA